MRFPTVWPVMVIFAPEGHGVVVGMRIDQRGQTLCHGSEWIRSRSVSGSYPIRTEAERVPVIFVRIRVQVYREHLTSHHGARQSQRCLRQCLDDIA